NKGRNKLVVEADINLHTALALRDFLVASGAEVIMSRSIDKTVDLGYRSEMANNSCADLFISVHHNAPGSNKDNWTNYTSTYYHALETDYEYEPMERDMARYVQRDLSYAMRNPGGLGSFDGTYSDYIIYPNSGFSVLRRTKIPSILVECSFFSHTNEETRLANKDFNRIAGFGIFRGLSRYLKNSIPKITPLNSECAEKSLTLSFSVQDSVKLLKNTVKVFIDKKQTNDFSFSNGRLIVNTPYSYKAPLNVKILVQNERGNFSEPFQQTYFFIKPSKE
ncbi:MAG: N-acetylmuramoyl-L-alanine amidase, partial [Ignavibacteriales bacterium]|nr:N-acetylmuramoyl-L-alanine amidase [Ignavibacteriales bacterium]